VVQKRTHCRLFTPENGGQTLGNALPSTPNPYPYPYPYLYP
jgi:hypothetical protein